MRILLLLASGFREWDVAEWSLLIGVLTTNVVAIIVAVKAKSQSQSTEEKTQNLAGAAKDAATDRHGEPLPNVSPETIRRLESIENGGVGQDLSKLEK